MKKYIKPEILEELVELEDVIAMSSEGEGVLTFEDETEVWGS